MILNTGRAVARGWGNQLLGRRHRRHHRRRQGPVGKGCSDLFQLKEYLVEQFYRLVGVELTVGGVPMVGYRQGIPGVDYSIELTIRNPDQPAPRLAAEPPIVGKMGTTASGSSSASGGASSASSRAPTTENPGAASVSSRPHAAEHQATAASASSASTTENQANAAGASSAHPAYPRLGVVAEIKGNA